MVPSQEQKELAARLAKCASAFVDPNDKGHSKGYREMDRAAGIDEGWTATTIFRLMNKDQVSFGIDKAIAVARACRVSLDWLLTGEERGMSPEIVAHVEALARAIPERKGVKIAPESNMDRQAPNAPKTGDAVDVASGRDENDLALAGGDNAPDSKPPHAPGGKGRKRKVVSR